MKILNSIFIGMGTFIFSTKIFCAQVTEDDLKNIAKNMKPLETHEHEVIESDQKTDVIYYTEKQPSTTYSIVQTVGEPNYLATFNTVNKGSYQQAIFGSKDYVDYYPNQCSTKFTLTPEKDGTYIIQTSSGEPSYLATFNTVNKGSYQQAIFGSKDYVSQHNYFNFLKLVQNQ